MDTDLHYLDARDVSADAARGMVVESADGRALGRLDGFMVDHDWQRLAYYVVAQTSERRQQLAVVPFVPAHVDADLGVIRLIEDALAEPLG
jgi:hypothetical protein